MTRTIPFVYNSTVSYKIELGYKYARFSLDDVFVCQIVTPYIDTDLLRIHYKQIGNTMRLVHPSYKPHKITRISSTLFAINEIEFEDGPFMTRNDLLGTDSGTPAYMEYTGNTEAGSVGSLLCCQSNGSTGVSFFDPTHVGALFKLVTKRTKTVASWSYTPDTITYEGTSYDLGYASQLASFLSLSQMDIKGTYTFTTSNFIVGTNEGTIILERSENGGTWETVRSETSSVVYSGVEKEKNVLYRSQLLKAADGGTTPKGTIKANLTVSDSSFTTIVRVIGYTSASTVSVQLLSKLDSVEGIKATQRWAEGAWSDYRGWPTSLTFYNDRCIYGGMKTIPEQVVY